MCGIGFSAMCFCVCFIHFYIPASKKKKAKAELLSPSIPFHYITRVLLFWMKIKTSYHQLFFFYNVCGEKLKPHLEISVIFSAVAVQPQILSCSVRIRYIEKVKQTHLCLYFVLYNTGYIST